jgi:hypothetical protein
MAVHPIEERYGTPEMRAVWSKQNRFSCIVAAEVALAKAQAMHGMIPAPAADAIEANAPRASPARANAIESEIGHDMMAVVKAIAEVCGDAGRWVHYGATSNDILDTATALQLARALDLLEGKLHRLLGVLLRRANETKALVCVGRTHGQHGVPTTYGLRLCGMVEEPTCCAPNSSSTSPISVRWSVRSSIPILSSVVATLARNMKYSAYRSREITWLETSTDEIRSSPIIAACTSIPFGPSAACVPTAPVICPTTTRGRI